MAQRPNSGKRGGTEGIAELLTLPAEAIKSKWSEAINHVAFGGKRIVCTRHGKPVAVLVPVADVPGVLDAA